jgi:UDP-N-acetylglucosamine acyltransferase
MIHSSAIVDPRAEIAADVDIGPAAIIEGPVAIGAGTRVEAHAVLSGQVIIGRNNRVCYGAIVGSYPQDFSFDPKVSSGVRIGDNNVLREYCTIHRGTKENTVTTVGSDNFFMAGAHLGHNARVGDRVVLANNVLLGGYAEIHDRAFLGGGSVVHQFTRIGTGAILQGLTAVSKDIPPFCVAAGRNSVVALNVIGLRRASFDAALRQRTKEAFRLLYESGLNVSQALASAQQQRWPEELTCFWDFVRQSKRGICSLLRWSAVKAGAKDDRE